MFQIKTEYRIAYETAQKDEGSTQSTTGRPIICTNLASVVSGSRFIIGKGVLTDTSTASAYPQHVFVTGSARHGGCSSPATENHPLFVGI